MDTYIITSDTMEAVSLVAAQREPKVSREAPGGTRSGTTFLLSKDGICVTDALQDR